jgi:hypothetical protein
MERIVKTNLGMAMTSAVGKTSLEFNSGIGESFQLTPSIPVECNYGIA